MYQICAFWCGKQVDVIVVATEHIPQIMFGSVRVRSGPNYIKIRDRSGYVDSPVLKTFG